MPIFNKITSPVWVRSEVSRDVPWYVGTEVRGQRGLRSYVE
ncbi:MAG: hypothetical protein ACFBSE_21770 [Prochloraceae cyanobacterium]